MNRVAVSMLCKLLNSMRRMMGLPPSLTCWLRAHPRVAGNIKWNFRFDTSAYDVPETAKKAWPSWSAAEKLALELAFEDAWVWCFQQQQPLKNLMETLQYPPPNVLNTSNSGGHPHVAVTEAYAWELYIRWIAVNFLVELGGLVKWSILSYTDEQLQVLLDSNAIMARTGAGDYDLCSGFPGHFNYVKRKDNLGGSLIAPPRYTLAFLANAKILKKTRIDTIAKLLQWISKNCVHFYGAADYGNMDNHWQYRGIPPISRVIEGTTDGATKTWAHWTAGCHGTTGFLRNVLRAVNIPVHIHRICGHSQAYFSTEHLYLDHGDNPYNLDFKATGRPAIQLLIEEETHRSWFGPDPNNHAMNCQYIGERVRELS